MKNMWKLLANFFVVFQDTKLRKCWALLLVKLKKGYSLKLSVTQLVPSIQDKLKSFGKWVWPSHSLKEEEEIHFATLILPPTFLAYFEVQRAPK